MKILQVVPYLEAIYGGPSRVVSKLAKALVKQGVDVDIVTTALTGSTHKSAGMQSDLDGGVRIFTALRRPLSGRLFMYSPTLARWLKDKVSGYDLVHVHTVFNYPTFAASRAAHKAGRPYLLTPHGMLEPWCLAHKGWKKRPYLRLVESSTLEHAAKIQTLTVRERDNILALLPEVRTAVVPNGIDADEFSQLPERAVFEKAFPGTRGKQIILFMGRIDPKKGLDLLVTAFTNLKREHRHQNACLVFAGPDLVAYRTHIEDLCARQDIVPDVVWTGMLDGDLRLAALGAADIFVLPSRSEGFSMSILEAMAAGCAVVISDECNFPEVRENNAGIVIKVDVEQLQEALGRLLDDEVLRQTLATRGASLVRNHYDWTSIAGEMKKIYIEAIQPAPHRSA